MKDKSSKRFPLPLRERARVRGIWDTITAWGAKAGIFIFLLFTFSPPLTEIGVGIVLVCALTRALLLRDVIWHVSPLDLILGLFFFVLILSGVFSIAPLYSFVQLKLLRFFALVYAVRYLDLDEKFTRQALLGFVFSLSLLSLYAVIQYHLGGETLPWFHDKLQWEGRIQPGIGQLALCASVPCLALLIWGGKLRLLTVALVLALVSLLSAMYFSFARSVWIAFATSGFALAWMRSRVIGMGAVAACIVVVGIFLALPQTKIGGLLYSMTAPLDPGNPRYASNMERIRMAHETIAIVKERPFLGLGFDAYRLATPSTLKRISSDYLQFLANTGVLGLLAYLGLLGYAMRVAISRVPLAPVKGERARVRGNAVAMGVIGFLVAFIVCGAFEPMFFGTRTLRLLPFFLGLTFIPSPRRERARCCSSPLPGGERAG